MELKVLYGAQPGNVLGNCLCWAFFSMRASSVDWERCLCRITMVADETVGPQCGMYRKHGAYIDALPQCLY